MKNVLELCMCVFLFTSSSSSSFSSSFWNYMFQSLDNKLACSKLTHIQIHAPHGRIYFFVLLICRLFLSSQHHKSFRTKTTCRLHYILVFLFILFFVFCFYDFSYVCAFFVARCFGWKLLYYLHAYTLWMSSKIC